MLTTSQMLEYLGLCRYEFQRKYAWVIGSPKFQERLKNLCLEKMLDEALKKQRMERIMEDGIVEMDCDQ